jgi:hypothetical protein
MLQQGLSVRDQQRVVAVARDGRRTLLHVNAALTHTETGAVHGMIAVFRDLSAQTEAETRRQREQERLRRVFRSVTQRHPAGRQPWADRAGQSLRRSDVRPCAGGAGRGGRDGAGARA